MSRILFGVLTLLFVAASGHAAAANDPRDESAIMKTLEAMAHATVHKDFAALEKLYGDDVTYGHSSGATETRAEMIAGFRRPERIAESMTFSGTTIRIYGDVALAKGITDFRNGTVGNIRDSHHNILWVLVRRAQGPHGWQIVARQTTRIEPTVTQR
jgi:ketosteroid isomerase-like protein